MMTQFSRYRFLSALVFFITLAFATPKVDAQLRYGFRFGGDFASSSLKDAPGYTPVNRSGFEGGLALEYQFKNCGLAPDIAVVYARHNSRIQSPDGPVESAGRNFIDIPVRIKYKFWLSAVKKLVGPMIYTGPVMSFRTGSDKTFYSTKSFQPSWEAGIGFDIVNFIQISGGYRFGLGNSLKDFPAFPDATLKADGWNVAVTLLFDF